MSELRTTYHLGQIECPYCGYIERDAWDWLRGEMECTEDWECPSCEQTSTLERYTEVSYTATVKPKEGELCEPS